MSVQVTDKDIVLLGHGSYSGGADHTQLPKNIDLIILQPVGYALLTTVAKKLIQQDEIKTLTLHHENRSGTSIITAPSTTYKGGGLAPNLKLYDLGALAEWGREVIGDRKNVVTVHKKTLLSDLINDEKIQAALKQVPTGTSLKLYWSACVTQIPGNWAGL